MKKVIVVSKTHLDLGFTDLAENIRKKYIDEFIPNAVDIAESVNNSGDKKFVWTTGSYILNEALANGSEENKKKLIKALKSGDIVPHALPFTMHSELLDRESFEYGLSIVDRLDEIRGRKTISAKMTDVPGHTKAIVPLLYNKGIKLLHIGVNGASAMPDVPECFLWKCGDCEVVVIYSGEYGGAYKNEYIDDILYFDHTLDNHGAAGESAVYENLKLIQNKYPDYKIVAGTLDDYAEQIWNVRDKLPVVTSEIGDSWIHGSAADPYKSAALRTLISFKNKWLSNGTLNKGSEEYVNLEQNILCLAEHTCGMDVKIALGEYENYLKDDFSKARLTKPYKLIEKSWAEQRAYIDKALGRLTKPHFEEIKIALNRLIPHSHISIENNADFNKTYKFRTCEIKLNSYANIENLIINGKKVIENNDKSLITYDSFCQSDYDFWFSHYSRNLEETKHWSLADFGKPNIGKLTYPHGRFDYNLDALFVKENDSSIELVANLTCDSSLCEKLGAPRLVQTEYTLCNDKLEVSLCWFGKDANRLPESIMAHLYPLTSNVKFTKLNQEINPFDVVKNGNRNLSAVQNVKCDNVTITNFHSPLAGIGKGKILRFDNKYSNPDEGISFVLYDNIWGTNFPLWYSDNAYFKFTIE